MVWGGSCDLGVRPRMYVYVLSITQEPDMIMAELPDLYLGTPLFLSDN